MTEPEARAWFNHIGQCQVALGRMSAALLIRDIPKFERERAAFQNLIHAGEPLKISFDAASGDMATK